MMVSKAVKRVKPMKSHDPAKASKINICVRKRPTFQKELENGEIDCVSCSNPVIFVHECKYKVDGVTKTVENHGFAMDNTFGESETTRCLYENSIQP